MLAGAPLFFSASAEHAVLGDEGLSMPLLEKCIAKGLRYALSEVAKA